MFRFSIRELMLVTLVVASLTGCKARSAVAPQPTALPAAKVAAAPQQITKERAVEIVRELLAKQSPDTVCDCKASESADEFSVFVIFGSKRDESGRLEGVIPGGHCLYRLSKMGKVIKIMQGA
jgi:hypothetical protein